MKRKHIAKRRYRYSLFKTDEETDKFFNEHPDPMERFHILLNAACETTYQDNPCPFQDCPQRKEKILDGNVVQYNGMLFDSQECLERMRAMHNDTKTRWCYFDDEELSHHTYLFDATKKTGVNSCRCGLKEAIYDFSEKGWIYRYKKD